MVETLNHQNIQLSVRLIRLLLVQAEYSNDAGNCQNQNNELLTAKAYSVIPGLVAESIERKPRVPELGSSVSSRVKTNDLKI